MSKRRILVGVALLAAMLAGLWFWGGRGEPTTASSQTQKPGPGMVKVERADPTTGLPRWFGQHGVAGRRIAGIVVGDDGAPVVGATVRLSSTYTLAGLHVVPKKQTDASGRFDFGMQPSSPFVVSAQAAKLTAAVQRVDLRDPNLTAPDQLRLVMHACNAAIHGTIYDTVGGAIGGATIARTENIVPTGVEIEADDAGKYELCIPAGGVGVKVSADGYAALSERVDVYGRTRRDFRLIPGTTVIGRVIRADDRSPVADAVVQLHTDDRSAAQAALVAGSDPDGKFQFEGVAPGRHQITAYGDGLATRHGVAVIAEIGAAQPDVVCELAATVTVSGTVVETGTKKPIAGRTVYLASKTQSAERTRPRYVVSQADGTFAIDSVLPGDYMPMVTREQGGQIIKVEAKDVSGVVIEVARGGAITGRVLLAGKPVEGAMVRAGTERVQMTATSDALGQYAVRGLEPGTYKVYSESHRVGAFTRGPSVAVSDGETKSGVDIELDLAGSIAGVVVDQNDAPIAGVFLTFSLLHGRDFGNATTADDGSFIARSLSGGGEYLYEVKQREGSPLVYPPLTGKRHAPVAVADGTTHVTGVRVRIKYERLVIAGRVTDPDGKPVPDAAISALPRDDRWFRITAATSDQTGAFTIHDLPAGNYTVQARTARGEARVEQVAAGRTDVAIYLLQPGGIDGTLAGFTGAPDVVAYRIDEGVTRYRATVAGMSFKLRDLPVGRYRVSTTGGDASAVVEVKPATIATVSLTMRELGSVAGTVLDQKTRKPISGLQCMAARQDDGDIEYDMPRQPTTSDAAGKFRIDSATAGPNMIACYGEGYSSWSRATVTPGQVTTVEVLVTKESRDDERRRSGLTLEDQLGEVFVEAVAPGSPAARAGILVGDVIVTVDGVTVGRYQSRFALRSIEDARGDEVKLVLERNDKQITVALKLEPASGSGAP